MHLMLSLRSSSASRCCISAEQWHQVLMLHAAAAAAVASRAKLVVLHIGLVTS
jgi:hypothetical protein